MRTLLGHRARTKLPAVVPIGFGLKDEREECFCLLIADGLAVALAYRTAGFKAKADAVSALNLYKAQRIQERITAILRARAASPAVSLPEVTDMLKRVYAGAIHSSEFTPAHNAAFSLARLYGLVVDKAQIDVIRRPSREPDAPAEQALGSWIEALPSAPRPLEPPLPAHSPAPIGPGPQGPIMPQGSGLLLEATTNGSDLDAMPLDLEALGEGPGRTGNGAPSRPVTGAPTPRAHSENVAELDEGTSIPSAEDLF